jgi:hypothetical protein
MGLEKLPIQGQSAGQSLFSWEANIGNEIRMCADILGFQSWQDTAELLTSSFLSLSARHTHRPNREPRNHRGGKETGYQRIFGWVSRFPWDSESFGREDSTIIEPPRSAMDLIMVPSPAQKLQGRSGES